ERPDKATTQQSYQVGFSAGYRLTKSAYLNTTYTYTLLDSNLAGGSYYQNQLVLDLRYTF
ncbi:MAG: hypothetical protein RL380_395, partial [Verrucomicrobiota bacterium]